MQYSFFAIDERNLAQTGTGIGVAVIQCDTRRVIPERGNVQRFFTFRTLDNG